VRSLRNDAAERIGEEAASPELQARAFGAVAAYVAVFMSDAVDSGDIHAVGNGVGALDGLPGLVLRDAELIFLSRMPADRGGIEKHFGALQRSEAGALRVPLIPADERAHAAECGISGAESEIAGREVVLFVVQGIVGDVHLAIDACDASVERDRHRGVVVESRSAPLKERCDDDNARLARNLSQRLSGRAGDGFRKIEEVKIFALAEILSAKQLGQTDDVCSETSSLPDVADRRLQVYVRVGAHAHLNQTHVVLSFVFHVTRETHQTRFRGDAARPTPRGGIGLSIFA
jgi:hypothetical protein